MTDGGTDARVDETAPEDGSSYEWPVDTDQGLDSLKTAIKTEQGSLHAEDQLTATVSEYDGMVSLACNESLEDTGLATVTVTPATARAIGETLIAAADWADKRGEWK